MTTPPLKMLILGGSSEAMQLARSIEGDARFAATYSIAGRTHNPRLPDLPGRCGGFGGIAGLEDFIRSQGIELVVDATHPFAQQMSRHAAAACQSTGTRLLAIRRPAWIAQPGDDWQCVPDMAAAVDALGDTPRRVLLTIGREELDEFARAPWHFYVIRSVDPPRQALPNSLCLPQRGPFDLAGELALLDAQAIEVMVSKNSGGDATQAKLEAARQRRLKVIMVERPASPVIADTVPDARSAMDWLEEHHREVRPTERGV